MKNEFQHNDDGTTHIFVESKSKYFPGKHTIIIDTEDWDKVKEHKWRILSTSSRYPYARTDIPHPNGGKYIRRDDGYPRKRMTSLLIHHLIMGKPREGNNVDHINHGGLDNRKENLRFVTIAQNQQNSRSQKNSTSTYRGVSRHKRTNNWQVKICHKGKQIHIGYFSCKHQAAIAWNKKATELWGEEHVFLNKVEKQ